MTTSPIVPIAFGLPEYRMFGAYHLPRPGSEARAWGIVLCPPLGWEMIASHRAYRELAVRLSEAGFHVLRFDYAGTGDSTGDETEPERVPLWIDSIGHAVEALQQRAPVSQVVLVGTRLGATLVGAYSAQRAPENVAALVLWAPYLTGRNFLREVQAYQAINNERSVNGPAGVDEAAGFVLTPETTAALNGIDLVKLRRPRTGSVLLLGRDETSPEQKLESALQQDGLSVELARISGMFPMLQEPRKSVVPTRVFDHMIAWLLRTSPGAGINPSAEPLPSEASIELAEYSEHATFFGAGDAMFGIATFPRQSTGDRPAVILLNTASDHRVGPNRAYVPLARQLAALGYASFRFDPRGVGDGAQADASSHAYSNARLNDVKEAIEWFQHRYGIDKFVMIGLCSGAYVAFHLGIEDARVVGEILINPQTFAWREGDSLDVATRAFRSNRTYKLLLRNPKTWKRVLAGKVNVRGIALVLAKRTWTRLVSGVLPLGNGKVRDVKRTFHRKLRAGASVMLILSENDGARDFIEGHLGPGAKVFRAERTFGIQIVAGAHHTFSQSWAKARLGSLVAEHMIRNHP